MKKSYTLNEVLFALLSFSLLTTLLWSLPVILVSQCHLPSNLISFGSAHAAEGEKEQKRKTPLIREKTFKKLSEAQKLAEEEKFKEALHELDDLKSRSSSLNSYELAQMWNFYAYIYRMQEKFDKVIEAYNKVLQQPDIPEAMEVQSIYMLAQIYHFTEKFDKAIEFYKKWFAMTDTPSAEAYVGLGKAYYQVKKTDLAAENLNKAIAMSEEKGKTPQENWYSILLAIYHDQNNAKKMEQVLSKLMELYPKKSYWLQLAAVYDEQKRETDYLAALDAAYLAGYIDKEGYYLNLAALYRSADVPFKAATVIADGMKKGQVEENSRNLNILSSSWQIAKENAKAISSLEKAARLSNDGELMTWLGRAYLDNEEFDKAVKALRNGLERGGVKHPDKVHIWLGTALFNLDQLNEAEAAFKLALNSKQSAKIASQWVEYITGEKQRRLQLAKGRIN